MAFETDTAVTRIAEPSLECGVFEARLSDAFSFVVPSGGVLMAIALRAMAAQLRRPSMRVVSATSVFASPIPAGSVSIRVTVLRSGRSAAQVLAELTSGQVKDSGVHTLATFATPGEGPEVIDTRPPEVPEPQSFPRVIRSMPFFRNLDIRMARGFLPEESSMPAGDDARCVRWLRYEEPPRLDTGELDPLCLPAVADMMPTALWQKLGPSAPRRLAPSYDLTMHFLDPTDREWLLTSSWARRARSGYATADVEIWDDRSRLLAYGTQTMFFRPWPMSLGEL